MVDFKSSYLYGNVEVSRWKVPRKWPMVGLEEDCTELRNILASRQCNSLRDRDILAWSPNPKGVFMVASGHQNLIARKYGGSKVPWWKNVGNKFSWPKCNCFYGT